jgi:hypothetical protein
MLALAGWLAGWLLRLQQLLQAQQCLLSSTGASHHRLATAAATAGSLLTWTRTEDSSVFLASCSFPPGAMRTHHAPSWGLTEPCCLHRQVWRQAHWARGAAAAGGQLCERPGTPLCRRAVCAGPGRPGAALGSNTQLNIQCLQYVASAGTAFPSSRHVPDQAMCGQGLPEHAARLLVCVA